LVTQEQELTKALYLALIAPTEEQADKASNLAKRITFFAHLKPFQVVRAKERASALASYQQHR